MYSILPYPKGCFLSGSFAESFAPIIVMIDDIASLKLFTASIVIATELENIPTNALNADNMRFATIPIIPVLTIVFVLSIPSSLY